MWVNRPLVINEIIRQKMKGHEVYDIFPDETTRLDSLPLDSLDLTEIVMECEKEFNRQMSIKEQMALVTVGDLYEFFAEN